MNKQYKDQQGSAHALITLCLVIVLLFALGWIFWRNFIYKEPAKVVTQVVVVKPKSSTTTSTPASTTKYLTIKEWGVKFPYHSSDTLSYTPSQD